jgi:predicted nucleic acid-binding protein
VRRVVVDASALAAALFEEAEAAEVEEQLVDAQVFAPTLLKFELASVARKKIRSRPADATRILTALNKVLDPRRGIDWRDVDQAGVVLISHETGLSTYDASYLWLAGWLGADLVTLDRRLANTDTL